MISTLHSTKYRTKLPMETWGRAITLVVGDHTSSALALKRELSLGSYRTAWRMARIIREALQSVEWPLLTGEVELCDANLARRGRTPKSIWLAIERRGAGRGLIRGWQDQRNITQDLRIAATVLAPDATVITPPSGLYHALKTIGFRQQGESLGDAEALPAATVVVAEFRSMLNERSHHGLNPATMQSYLGEYLFRHNAKILGWTQEEQCCRVLAVLKAPRLSA